MVLNLNCSNFLRFGNVNFFVYVISITVNLQDIFGVYTFPLFMLFLNLHFILLPHLSHFISVTNAEHILYPGKLYNGKLEVGRVYYAGCKELLLSKKTTSEVCGRFI